MFTLREAELFSKESEKLGDYQRVDAALIGLTWAIAHQPTDFGVVPGFDSIRIAFSEPLRLKNQDGDVRLKIWFQIAEGGYVDLLSIKGVAASE